MQNHRVTEASSAGAKELCLKHLTRITLAKVALSKWDGDFIDLGLRYVPERPRSGFVTSNRRPQFACASSTYRVVPGRGKALTSQAMTTAT